MAKQFTRMQLAEWAVHVQRVDGKPKAYIVTNVHRIIPLSPDE
jgi:hypothetical protein